MPRRALALFSTFILLLVVAVSLAPTLSAARVDQVAIPPVLTVTLFGDTIVYRTRPNEMVLAELTHAGGEKITGTGFGDPSGTVTIQFFSFGMTGGDAVIRPGDRITLARFNQRPFTVDVPNLTADVDSSADRIVGTAPPGAKVTVSAAYGTGPAGGDVTRDVTADASGAFALDLAGQVDLPPGAVAGQVVYDTASDQRFIAAFAAFRGDVTIGAGQLSGSGTPGTAVQLSIRRSDGTHVDLPPTEVTGSTGWTVRTGARFGPGPSPTVGVGDTITLTRRGGPLGGEHAVHVTVPAITVDLDVSRDRVTGTAPAGSPLTVRASTLSGAPVTAPATTGADGAFAVDLDGRADLGPGWRVRASWAASPEMSVSRLAVVPQALVGVHTATVRGLADPGSTVTITLRAGDGTPRQMGVADAGDEGAFALGLSDFGLQGEVPIEPGDQIEVAFVGGDPLVAPVPALTARSDAAADTVSGTAGPGDAVRVVVSTDPGAPSVTATADAQGRYSASFSGRYDLGQPSDGRVFIGEGRSLAFYTTWSAIQLNVQRYGDAAFVSANGPPGRAYEARLVALGAVIGRMSGRAFDPSAYDNIVLIGSGGGNLSLMFADIAGDQVSVRAGDRIELVAGDDTATLVIPPLEAAAFVEDDVITGRTTPGATVTINIESPLGEQRAASATADATGAFLHDFGTDYDLQYNDDVQLSMVVDGHIVTSYVAVPGLNLDLDSGDLLGTLGPDTQVAVTVRRGGQTLFEQAERTTAEGMLYVRFADAAGEPLVLLPADRVVVHPTDPPGSDVWMDVPELTVTADASTDAISGRATPGGLLVVLADDAIMRPGSLGVAQAWPEIAPSGAWSARTVPSHDVQAGTTVRANYRVAAGHIATRSYWVPLAQVEHGGARVCGVARPGRDVAATLVDRAGAEVGTARDRTTVDASYHLTLRDQSAAPVPAASGHTVRATLGGEAATVALPEVSINVDWATNMIDGQGPPDTLFLVEYPARTCRVQEDSAMQTYGVMMGRIGPDGRMINMVPFPLQPGDAFEIGLDAAGGHRVFKQIVRTLGQVFIETDRVAGATTTLAPVTVRLAGPSGDSRATVQTAADAEGRFDTHLAGADGAAAVIHAGDRVALTSGTDAVTVTVEPLSFDWSPGESLVGQAPAGRAVAVELKLAYGRVLSIPRIADTRGQFVFGAADVPPRASWTWDDVAAVRVVLKTPEGHEIISQTDDFEATAAPRGMAIFLPIAHRGQARVTAAVADRASSTGPVTRPAPVTAPEADPTPMRLGPIGTWGASGSPVERWAVAREVREWRLAVMRGGR
jgi:hypothetical protein